MNGDSHHEPDDEFVAELLEPLDRDVAPIPTKLIERAVQQAGDQFAETPSATIHPSRGNRHVITKSVLALSAIVLGFIAIVANVPNPEDGSVTLGAILDQTGQVETLQLELLSHSTKADIWVRSTGQVRWEESSTRYQIASGSRRWRIDEEANTVEDQDNPWFRDHRNPVDLLALMGVEAELAAEFRQTAASRVETIDGARREFFTVANAQFDTNEISTYSDLVTGELQRIDASIGWGKGRHDTHLLLVARNPVIDEDQFVVSKTLSEDGRIGKVAQAQGIVTLRPLTSSRWTPVFPNMLVKPGDWLRSDVRGANALALSTTERCGLIVGPASLVELVNPRQARLHRGETKITASKSAGAAFELLGPGEQTVSVKAGESAHFRIDRDEQLVKVDKKPVWLAGFEGSSNNESIGSLVCNIDGRSTPLTVGFHKVKVEIRDQIARTTIEESFVNHTAERLEGIFHFPLPQDASISGFGMWINGELIEADVVEKQRAREIYETILREKRDPGLLEWTGGNIFKARVFPILPHAEKRIKIVYTQVLPMRANRYRYSYGLASEMLKKTPLRELSLEVLVNSTLPLKKVSCSTHEVRGQETPHSARLAFTAQEYTPTRDFEVVCEVDPGQSDVVIVPHQRGDDGYFLVQLTPPTGEGNWQREVLPDGSPLDLMLVCDTSASMDADKRKQQSQFVAATLATLGPRDRFNLAVSDVNCDWLHKDSVEPTPEAITVALDWLDKRISLGWTDLDRMTTSVLKRLQDQTHLVYIGDGVVTAGDADPQSFANRMQRLTSDQRTGTFHAVSIGSSYESTVLKAVARVGGGSVRNISGEQTPQQVAFELLNEIAQPGLRNLKVEFRGLKVAAVYPDTLPNIPAGTQQILVGRYLPQGEDQSGEIVITGQRDGKPVRFTSRIKLADAEAGNSFIPRLWARAHLDGLLEEGTSSFIQDQVIALSEEFHIITPYTSLLVLETDADRERFGVKRRYQMRDGERFFADGSSKANLELLQEQIKRAGDWRLGLRRQILAEFSRLGRDPQMFAVNDRRVSQRGMQMVAGSASAPRMAGAVRLESSLQLGDSIGAEQNWEDESDKIRSLASSSSLRSEVFDVDFKSEARKQSLDFDFDQNDLLTLDELVSTDRNFSAKRKAKQPAFRGLSQDQLGGKWDSLLRSQEQNQRAYAGFLGGVYGDGDYNSAASWLNTLAPSVPNVPIVVELPPEPEWPAEAIEISRRLMQPITLDGGGLELTVQRETADPRWKRQTGASRQLTLHSPKRWLSLTETSTSQTLVHWCEENERGVYSRAFQLGRHRKSAPRDLSQVDPGVRAYAVRPMHEDYRRYQVQLQRPGDDRVMLILTAPQSSPLVEQRFLVDTKRNVILVAERHVDGKLDSSQKYDNFAQVASVWWPGKIESFDAKSRRTSLVTQTVKMLKPAAFAKRYQQEMPKPETAHLLSMVLPSVRKSKVAVADGSADLEHRLVLLIQASATQNWDEVFEQLAEMEKLAPGKPGLVWIRAAVQVAARRNEDARTLLNDLADQIVAKKHRDELFLAEYALGQAGHIADQNEVLRLLDLLKPVFERLPAVDSGTFRWQTRYVQSLRSLGRTAEVLPRQRELAIAMPWTVSLQTSYARDLAKSGDHDAAWAWLRQELDRDVERSEYENQELRLVYATLLREQGLADDLVTFLKEWVETGPTDQDAYSQYLHSMILADRTTDADAIARQWIAAGRADGKLDTVTLAKLNTAASYARGQRYHTYMNWIDPVWFKDLEETARFFLSSEQHFNVASSIMDYHRFVDSDASDRLRTEAARRLMTKAADLPPMHIAAYVRWSAGGTDLTVDQWKRIAATLRTRWNQLENKSPEEKSHRQTIATALLKIQSVYFRDTEQLPFMRQRIVRAQQESDERQAAALVNALFTELLKRDWQADQEAEALALIPRLSAAESASVRWAHQITELHRFVDRMLAARQQHDQNALQEAGHPEELTRAELGKKQAEFRKNAQEGLAEMLAANAPEFDEVLGKWVTAERQWLDLQLGRKHKQVAAECWIVLGDAPRIAPDQDAIDHAAIDDGVTDEEAAETHRQSVLRGLLQQRSLAVVNYLAARRSAPKPLVARLHKYVDAGLAFEGDQARPWQQLRFALLIALDRPDDLERELRAWIREDKVPADWQLALGRLLAEQGQIEQAITLFETVQRTTQLASSDHAALSNWYLVTARRTEYESAKIDIFKSMEEYRLRQWLQQQVQPWNRSDVPLPTELDETVLFAFQALFEKSNSPGNYASQLREFYTACRDFRLLRMVPDALTGRTPQQVYPFLKALRSNLLHEIRKEATADELLARVAVVRESAQSAVDRRALDLLESMIERQAANVLNQPGPHIDAALTALQRAFERDWAEGEVRQMADLLADLGMIQHNRLNDERLRQLRELLKLTEAATEDRLFVSFYLASALYYSHHDRLQGLATLEAALREFSPTLPDGWPAHLNPILDGFVSMLDAEGQFTAAEKFLTEHLENPLNPGQARWLTARRNRLYVDALRKHGRVSLGAGEELFLNLEKHLIEQAKTDDDTHRHQLVSEILRLYQVAKDAKVPGAEKRLRAFAFEGLPPILKRQTNNYQYVVRTTADEVERMLGPRVAVQFLIERFETYPHRFNYTYEAPWHGFASKLAIWFKECNRNVGDYEPRLLAIVLDELRHDLRIRQTRNHYLYHRGYNQYFWEEKSNDFARVAEEIYQENKGSGRSVTHIAQYLNSGLRKPNRAIEIMLIAHQQGHLKTNQQIALCDYLHYQGRHVEILPILEPIVAAVPDTMAYRTRLIRAYALSSQKKEARTALTRTDEHFRQQGRWTEGNISQLARGCLDSKMFAEAAGYYGEVIPLHQRSRADGGIGSGALSGYYRDQSRAYVGLGDTIKAVDAASAAIVAGGARRGSRNYSPSYLDSALAASKDLDGYIRHLDKQTATTGQDSPLIRQRLGNVLARRNQHDKAVVQLRLAVALQPTDMETHKALIVSYDKLKDHKGAVRQTLALLDFDRHNLELYKKLAERLKSDEALFERAATTIVEAAPQEAEHHQALAEIRQTQDRWDEAIAQWKHVARLRALEPNGLLKLTEAQIHQKQWKEARKSIEKLNATEWARRFGQVRSQTEQLQRTLPPQ